MNPYAVTPATTNDARPRVTCIAVALLVTAPAIAFAAFKSFGPHGLACAVYGIVTAYFLVSCSSSPKFYPLNATRPNFVDFTVILAICGVLHGLALPTVVTNCSGRRSNATVVTSDYYEPPIDETVQADLPEPNVPTDDD